LLRKLESGKELKGTYPAPAHRRAYLSPLESGKELKGVELIVTKVDVILGWNPERN